MGINSVSVNRAASVLASTNISNSSAANKMATFQVPVEKIKTKLSLMDFYKHGDKSRLTDDEISLLNQAFDAFNKVNRGDTSFTDAKSYLSKYDNDHNGIVKPEELTQHIGELEDTRSSDFIGVNQELHFGLLLQSHYTGGSALFRPEDVQSVEGSQEAVNLRHAALLPSWGAINTMYPIILKKYSDLYI